MKTFFILLVAALMVACSPKMHRGAFGILSTEPIEAEYEILSHSRVRGRACFNMLKSQLFIGEGVLNMAVQEAISKVDDATVLLAVELKDTGNCIEVSGLAAR